MRPTIIREFGKFVERGGVYKGLKPVLWCTQDQTALAEAEVEYEEHTSPSIYVKFPCGQSSRRSQRDIPGISFPVDVKLCLRRDLDDDAMDTSGQPGGLSPCRYRLCVRPGR